MTNRRATGSELPSSRHPLRAALAALTLAAVSWAAPADAQTNVAPGGVATQSSDWIHGGVPASADRAIDGNTNGNFGALSVSHTAGGEADPSPFWELDLGADHQIDEIVLWNRTDCCAERLYLFTVRIADDAGNVTSLGKVFNPPAEVDYRPALPDGGVVGRFVRIDFDFDPANPTQRYAAFAEVQVFGAPVPAQPTGELPLDRTLPLGGSWTQKMKTFWDGPQDKIDQVLERLRKQGIDLDEIPYECSWQLGSDDEGSIRFLSGESARFEYRDGFGSLVTGTFKRKGADGETIKLKIDRASEKELEKILARSASLCARVGDFEEDSGEKFLSAKVDVKKAVLKGSIVEDETFVLRGKIRGSIEWKRKAKKLGKFTGSGKTTHKIRLETSIVEPPGSLPTACLPNQGRHLYPSEGALFQGWIEMTEIIGSDNAYLILTDDFVSILQDFEDSDSIAFLLDQIEDKGTECDAGGRVVVSVELTPFARDNLLFVINGFANLETSLSAQKEAAEKRLLSAAWKIVEDEIKAQVRKLVRKIVSKIITRIVKAIL
ncbi:MAG: discoidin domain-containing protein [Myxococcota bacterium]